MPVQYVTLTQYRCRDKSQFVERGMESEVEEKVERDVYETEE